MPIVDLIGLDFVPVNHVFKIIGYVADGSAS